MNYTTDQEDNKVSPTEKQQNTKWNMENLEKIQSPSLKKHLSGMAQLSTC